MGWGSVKRTQESPVLGALYLKLLTILDKSSLKIESNRKLKPERGRKWCDYGCC